MFGSKLKTWMENHIVRSRKKTQDKEKVKQRAGSGAGTKGPILESSESLAHSDTGISSSSQQVLSSSNTDNNEGYCTTTMESNRSGMAHCHTAVNLSSPESAYSTGYSTDGTSPGGTGPPEYYINIRTGKHYFPSPAPTPTSPQPPTAFAHLFTTNRWTGTPLLSRETAPHSLTTQPFPTARPGSVETMPPPASVSFGSDAFAPTLSPFVPGPKCSSSPSVPPTRRLPPKSPLNSFKLFLKSPNRQDKTVKQTSDDGRAETLPANGKKLSSPQRGKKWYKQPFHKFGHRRTDSADESARKCEGPAARSTTYFSPKDVASSPRQRNRIRTNPWLPTVDPVFSHNLGTSFPSEASRNPPPRPDAPLRNPTSGRLEPIRSRGEDPEECGSEKPFERRLGRKLLLESSDRSDEDLTLDEMMGTYNESYVYEKETDILSDSDPTDCEDYVSDSEADNGGDERDSHDDELDFIDDGSVIEGDRFLDNTGKCTYHDPRPRKNHFLSKGSRHRFRSDSDAGKSFRRDASHSKRTKRSGEESKRSKSFRRSGRSLQRKVSARSESSHPVKPSGPGKVLDMSKILLRRVNGESGSRSADGTPVCLRRRNLIRHVANAETVDVAPSRIRPLVEDDPETDKRYRQLIQEAETMFAEMRNSPVLRSGRKDVAPESARKEGSGEGGCRRVQETQAPATPKRNLALSLAPVDAVRKPECLLSKSSAHSPLDPLGPALKSLSIFGGIEMDDVSSDDSERRRAPSRGAPPAVVPIAFQSVDLGKSFASYCPQSEPVKRKIYSCGKAFEGVGKRLETEPEEGAGRGPDAGTGKFFYNPVYSPCGSPRSERKRCGGLEDVAGSPRGCQPRFGRDVDPIR